MKNFRHKRRRFVKSSQYRYADMSFVHRKYNIMVSKKCITKLMKKLIIKNLNQINIFIIHGTNFFELIFSENTSLICISKGVTHLTKNESFSFNQIFSFSKSFGNGTSFYKFHYRIIKIEFIIRLS